MSGNAECIVTLDSISTTCQFCYPFIKILNESLCLVQILEEGIYRYLFSCLKHTMFVK
jgi:hypothetical protein